MSIFDEDLTLPGVVTHVEADYAYGFDSSLFGSTDSEVVIGSAFNGPVGQIVPVYSVEHAVYIFGEAYDSKKRQEVSLVAGVQDAWNRGCRTIYCVRIGGREMYKDFKLKIDSEYKLRVSSMFPSNLGKECYFRYDDTKGLEEVTFYKPIDRATISEKKRGLASTNGKVMLTTIKLALDRGMTRDDRMVDFINEFNGNAFNNVIKLAIVDRDGNDVTTSPDVFDLPMGALYPGVYFIGRDSTSDKVMAVTETKFKLVDETTLDKPYTDFREPYYRELIINTDVSLEYPIYAKNMSNLRTYLIPAGISMIEPWDFLDTASLTDRAFLQNSEDYEETNLSKFEIYKRLGMGFAITAQCLRRVNSAGVELKPRVKETAPDDPNRFQPLVDGIYSMMENSNVKYRALVCVNAEDEINGKLPRSTDFKIASPNEIEVMEGKIKLRFKVDKKDLTPPIHYAISFQNIEEGGATGDLVPEDMIDASAIAKVVGKVDTVADIIPEDYDNGTMILVGDTLYRVGAKTAIPMTGAGLAGMRIIAEGSGPNEVLEADGTGKFAAFTPDPSKPYILGDILEHVFIYDTADNNKNVGDFKTLVSDDDDKIIVAADRVSTPGHTNHIVIRSNLFDTTTFEEFCEELNRNELFGRMIEASLTTEGSVVKDMFIYDPTDTEHAITMASFGTEIESDDRILTYDYNLYIPYRTIDNFARHLAQHCTYTELKTAPCHGMIGTKVLTNTGLVSVANKVSEIASKDFDLYAKTSTGRLMLDNNNLPYPIGKNISLVNVQYPVVMTTSNYQYLSNGAAGYAGFVTTLPADQSSTGQAIPVDELGYELTNSQIARLTAAGIVTLKHSYTSGIVVTDGITMAPAESIFRRLSTSRIVNVCEELIRAACEPFIGKENHQANRNALNTAIKANLDKIKNKLINDYEFKMDADPRIAKLSRIDISYRIIPIYEIREVRNSIKMVDSISTTTTTSE